MDTWQYVSMFFYLILLVLLILLIKKIKKWFSKEIKIQEDNKSKLIQNQKQSLDLLHKDYKFDNSDIIPNIIYWTGHPDIIEPKYVDVILSSSHIVFVENNNQIYTKLADIKYDQITNIETLDESETKRKVSGLETIAFGYVAANMSAKNVKVPIFYLIIEWNDGKYEHKTSIKFDKQTAVSDSNSLRSLIIKKSK